MKRPTAKRKRSSSQDSEPTCIVNVSGLKYGNLLFMDNMEGADNKLERLQEVKQKRPAEHHTSVHRMEEACNFIPNTLAEHHGFHMVCYKRFEINMDRLRSITLQPHQPISSKRTLRRSLADQILFNPDCIFWGSEGKTVFKAKEYRPLNKE